MLKKKDLENRIAELEKAISELFLIIKDSTKLNKNLAYLRKNVHIIDNGGNHIIGKCVSVVFSDDVNTDNVVIVVFSEGTNVTIKSSDIQAITMI